MNRQDAYFLAGLEDFDLAISSCARAAPCLTFERGETALKGD